MLMTNMEMERLRITKYSVDNRPNESEFWYILSLQVNFSIDMTYLTDS